MSRNSRRNTFIPPGFSIRRLLLQGARAARGSPPLGQRSCDLEKGNANSSSKKTGEGSNNAKHNYGDTVSQHSSTPPPYKSASNQQLQQQPQSSTQHLRSNQQSQQQPQQQLQSQQELRDSANSPTKTDNLIVYCPICYNNLLPESFFTLFTCKHTVCRTCLERYLKNEINESRTDIACPQCSEAMHPSNIETLLNEHPEIISKYEDFMVRRYLLSDPDSRWCPAPDCSYAVIATGCASCPRIRCQRPGCGLQFCYHCKAEWHPDQTCDAARAARQSPTRAPSGSVSQDSQHRDDIKPCPRCQMLIVKMDDGSCNHMVCSVCGSEFCWLCMKEITDLHYLSPSGCTFWGKKPWSRKKKLLWQLGTLVGAPVGIALVAGIAVPAMIIGIPVWVGKKIHARYQSATKHKRNCAVLSGVAASILVSPVLAGLAVAIGVPILLFYVYGVVPVSLCRGGCGVTTSRDGFKFEFDEEEDNQLRNQGDGASVDAVSRIGATSIGEVSLSVASGSHIGVPGQNTAFGVAHASNRESTTALAGSITGHRLEVQADVSSSETASAVTCVSEKSGNTLNDTASTRALAGSILSYKHQLDSSNVSEDGVSERVRFDNTVCYVIDGKRDCSDVWYTAPLDQDSAADKSSVGSSRSFRSSERSFRDEIDSSSSSGTKRLAFAQRMPKLSTTTHRTLSLDSNTGSNYIPENVSLEQQAEEEDKEEENDQKLNHPATGPSSSSLAADTQPQGKAGGDSSSVSTNGHPLQLDSPPIKPTANNRSDPPKPEKNPSKSSILRNLFFSQGDSHSNQPAATTTPAGTPATDGGVSSKPTKRSSA